MYVKNFKVGDLMYICKTGTWRDGFTHKVEIQNRFGETLIRSCTKYYNRTWESYDFQCAMRQAQESLIRKIARAKQGKVWINYRYEDFKKYDFEKEPERVYNII